MWELLRRASRAAAGGRTLALFTSWKAMDAAAASVAGRVPNRILSQREMQKNALVKAFSEDESSEIDIPRASTLLAQATGRLIRTATDRGVVAVFDPRLGKANYRWDIVKALPPMRRTRDRAEVEAFLREITG